ncbi:hypothetical protein D9758_002169 [Tetrapyrgos nigripes]|uniref:DH domain-containing protein n=1 Tax=Tetrapyrgos nigripes TaxID=182062 RepID=A0A8H5GP13_9AGAR|nr:hypothetical protein D9758_002169 [Tetrapyrgos nigripes]
MPQRKLSKPRRSVPHLPLPLPPQPPPPLPPKRRQSFTLNFTQTIKRRFSTKKEKKADPEPEPLPIPVALPSKQKIFTLNDDEPTYETRVRPSLPFTISDGSNSGSASTESAGSTSKRRWTLAMAMTSQDLSDEVFVADVERIRQTVNYDHRWNWESGLPDDPDTEYIIESPTSSDDGFTSNSHFGPSIPGLQRRNSDHNFASIPARSYRAPTDPGHGPPDKAWSSALRALLITRDLLRTERNYLASLKILLDSSPCNAIITPGEFGFLSNNLMGRSGSHLPYPLVHVAPPPSDYLSASVSKPQLPWPSRPPPPLMHTYISALIAVSTILIRRLEADPTIDGAARAFIGCSSSFGLEDEDEDVETLERVFVGWCGIVGGWFAEEESNEKEKRRRRKLSKTRSMRLHTDLTPHHGPESPSPMPKSASRAKTNSYGSEQNQEVKEWRCKSSVSLFKRHTTYSDSSIQSQFISPPESDLESPNSSTLNVRKLAGRSSSLSLAKNRWRKSMPSVPSLSFTSTPFPPRPESSFIRSPSPPPPVPPKPAHLHLSMSPIRRSSTSTPATPVSPTTIYTSPSAATSGSTCTPVPTTPTPTRGSPFPNAMGSGRRAFDRERDENFVFEESVMSTPSPLGRGRQRDAREIGIRMSYSWSETSFNGNSTKGNGVHATSEAPLINGKRVHSVRELAILPVQRVTRYVLLYRDLLKHTPATSPSRALLERAAETADRIAQKCDRAQENSRFLWSPMA